MYRLVTMHNVVDRRTDDRQTDRQTDDSIMPIAASRVLYDRLKTPRAIPSRKTMTLEPN